MYFTNAAFVLGPPPLVGVVVVVPAPAFAVVVGVVGALLPPPHAVRAMAPPTRRAATPEREMKERASLNRPAREGSEMGIPQAEHGDL